MRLEDLNLYSDIVIQCHDNPDADALASGFGLYVYFKSKQKNVRLIYGGRFLIQKSNLKLMINELCIPIEYVKNINKPDLLITVDCQYKEGNVTYFEANNVAIIDHHEICCETNKLTDIRNNYGSCSTVVYSLLKNADFNINNNQNLATALYYGLYMDTNGFGEIKHPLDMDMIEDLYFNDMLIEKLKNTNFSLKELETAGIALLRYTYNKQNNFAIVKSNPCDPNILGLISDLVLQVENVDICIVYNELDYGYKLSIRSCIREVTANDLAVFLTNKIGNGGGHKKKAGGFIVKSKLTDNINIETFLLNKMDEYFKSYIIFDSENDNIDISNMQKYKKRAIPVGYVHTSEIAPSDTKLKVRTLEGDVSIKANDDIYIMIGINGEVYPIKREKFNHSYKKLDKPFKITVEYEPTVRNILTNEVYNLFDYSKSCIAKDDTIIYAKPVDKTIKVFTKWDYDSYMLGHPKDYLAARLDDIKDVYIIKNDIFDKIYEKI